MFASTCSFGCGIFFSFRYSRDHKHIKSWQRVTNYCNASLLLYFFPLGIIHDDDHMRFQLWFTPHCGFYNHFSWFHPTIPSNSDSYRPLKQCVDLAYVCVCSVNMHMIIYRVISVDIQDRHTQTHTCVKHKYIAKRIALLSCENIILRIMKNNES